MESHLLNCLSNFFFVDTSVPETSSSTVANIKTEKRPTEPAAAEQLKTLVEKEFVSVDLKKRVEKEFYPVEAPTTAGIYIFFFNLTLPNMCQEKKYTGEKV